MADFENFTYKIKKELNNLLARIPEFEKYLFRLDYVDYPWEFLNLFDDVKFLPANPSGAYPCKAKGTINSGKNCKQKEFSSLYGPIIMGNNVTIDSYVKIRPFTIICDDVYIGPFCEIKNSIILPHSRIPHHNYVGDSVVGKNCNLGSGTKLGNFRFDKKNIRVKHDDKYFPTNREKLGAILEDNVNTGCNVILNPGTYVKQNTLIYSDPKSLIYKSINEDKI